jgi:hypothetical protein
MRFAYADPPYLGLAEKFYGDPTYDDISAHQNLVARLGEFDGWAMSMHSPSLKHILPLCPDDARVMAWVKPFASFKPGVNPGYCWEPVIVRGGRKYAHEAMTVRDYVSTPIALRRGLKGAKPDRFCFWIFAVLGAVPDDEFVDLFPGSGAVTRAWESFRRQHRMAV